MTFFYSHSIYQPNQAQPSPIYIKNFMLENFHNGCCEIFPSYITYILGERVSLPTLRPFSTHCVNYSSYNWEDNFVKYIIFCPLSIFYSDLSDFLGAVGLKIIGR